MYYGKLYKTSIVDGPGVRVSLYVSGCRNHCEGCHNPESWCFRFGKEYTQETENKILDLLSRPYISGFTLCGGEPMEPENQKELVCLLRKIKEIYPEKSIWCYSGYEFEDLLDGGKRHTEVTDEMLSYIDVAIVGKFILSKRDISEKNLWRGSTNQRLIDVQKSLKTKSTILYNKED